LPQNIKQESGIIDISNLGTSYDGNATGQLSAAAEIDMLWQKRVRCHFYHGKYNIGKSIS
jgi:hypothetical protein